MAQVKYQPHGSPSPATIATSSSVKKQQPPGTSSCSSQQQQHASGSSLQSSPESSKSDSSSLANSSSGNSSSDQVGADVLEILEEKVSGYNSGDEHLGAKEHNLSSEEWKKRDEKFSKLLSDQGLIIKEMEEDGACLFRAISYQLYGDQEMHDMIRQRTMDYIFQNREYFAQFITEDITHYVNRKRQNHLHGNHIEIQAMSEMYNRPVELYCYEMTPINIYNSEQINNGYQPLRLSYHRYSHYNAILDPYKSSVGVGLGLAGYRPEDFDPAKQVSDAVQLSEQLEIEKMMVEDKLKTTDWEATSDVVVEQIARQSYLQFCKENMEKKLNGNKSSTSTVTSTEACGSSSSTAQPCNTPVAGLQTQSCSSNQAEQDSSPYVMEYYMKTSQTVGRRSKKRHHHHHQM